MGDWADVRYERDKTMAKKMIHIDNAILKSIGYQFRIRNQQNHPNV